MLYFLLVQFCTVAEGEGVGGDEEGVDLYKKSEPSFY